MERIVKERDRLLQRSARIIGLISTLAALICLCVPGAVDGGLLVILFPLFALMVFGQWRLGISRKPLGAGLTVLGGFLIVLFIHLANVGALSGLIGIPASPPGLSESADIAIRIIASGAVACVAVVLTFSLGRMIVLAGAFAVTFTMSIVATASSATLGTMILVVLTGWAIGTATGFLLSAGVVRAARRISNIGRAHRTERQASETEAQRRQGARLLHDTVLATLTLLAHSGVGVGVGALRHQAGDDARLLRQLRLGTSATPASSQETKLEPVEESVLGNTLESVKQRFGRMGLTVSWHGTGQVLLPSDVLDAFLLSLAECLENVRRHAGVTEAHVTITDDDTTVRAMVTDSGVGFDLAEIGEGRLGFKESVVARLKEVGGNARVFSAAGSGTTVVLEVPK